MANFILSQDHVKTLLLPSLMLEVYAERNLIPRAMPLLETVQTVWPVFLEIAKQEKVFDILSINPDERCLQVELTWADNEMMQALNRNYRAKDAPTDVLTFPLIGDASDQTPWIKNPDLPLGNIFVSIEWAEAEAQKDPNLDVTRYLMERFVHGLLHLLGMHHNTMPQYRQVVAIQQKVLSCALKE